MLPCCDGFCQDIFATSEGEVLGQSFQFRVAQDISSFVSIIFQSDPLAKTRNDYLWTSKIGGVLKVTILCDFFVSPWHLVTCLLHVASWYPVAGCVSPVGLQTFFSPRSVTWVPQSRGWMVCQTGAGRFWRHFTDLPERWKWPQWILEPDFDTWKTGHKCTKSSKSWRCEIEVADRFI